MFRPPLITRIAAVSVAVALLPAQSVNLLATTLAAPSAKPFTRVDQPSPTLRKISPTQTQGLAFQRNSTILAPPNVKPFKRDDWQNPRGKSWPQAPLERNSVILSAVKSPFAQRDWPNPLVRATGRIAFGWQNLSVTTLAVTATPFVQIDWPNPRKATRATADGITNLLISTLAPAIASVPFSQIDWALPVSAKHQVWQSIQTQNLLGTTLVPSTLYNDFHRTYRRTSRR